MRPDIVRYARTSKRTFYSQYSSKEDCFIELLRKNNDGWLNCPGETPLSAGFGRG